MSKIDERAKLSRLESSTLLAFSCVDVGDGLNFRGVAENCKTPPHNIRRAVRALARKGCLKYQRTLFCEDDNRITAGYVLTKIGSEEIQNMEVPDEAL